MILQGLISGIIASAQLMNLISLGPQLFISFHSFQVARTIPLIGDMNNNYTQEFLQFAPQLFDFDFLPTDMFQSGIQFKKQNFSYANSTEKFKRSGYSSFSFLFTLILKTIQIAILTLGTILLFSFIAIVAETCFRL